MGPRRRAPSPAYSEAYSDSYSSSYSDGSLEYSSEDSSQDHSRRNAPHAAQPKPKTPTTATTAVPDLNLTLARRNDPVPTHFNNTNNIPYPHRPDLRFPTPPTSKAADGKPILLHDPRGDYALHLMLLLHPTPSSAVTSILAKSRTARAPTLATTHPEQLIHRAVEAKNLVHVNDGPGGGVWFVESAKIELVTALVEEMEALKAERVRVGEGGSGVREDKEGGSWRVLGEGKGGDEGRVFLIHACGWGPKVLVVEGKGKGKGTQGGKKKGRFRRFLDKL